MNTLRRGLMIVGGSIAAAGLAYAATPRKKLADILPKVDLEAMFPPQFAQWQMDRMTPVIQPSPEVQATLNKIYNQTLARTYINEDGTRVMLSVAYGGDQSDGLAVHLPEVCYPGQGFEISGLHNEKVALAAEESLLVRRMQAVLGRRIEQVTYWTTMGGIVTTGGSNRKLTQMRYSLTGVIPDGFLVRVSSLDSRRREAAVQLDSFAKALRVGLSPTAVPRIYGDATKSVG